MNVHLTHNEYKSYTHSMDLIMGFIKWSLVIALLLFSGGPLIVSIFGVLFGVAGSVKKSDLFFLFFLTGFVNGSLGNFEGYAIVRYLLLVPLIINSRSAILARKAFTLPLLVFFLYLLGHGFVVSPNPIYSLLNTVTALLTIAAGFAAVYSDRKECFWSAFQAVGLAVAFWSLISIPFPEFSYIRNGVGLQGIGTHPNLFAVFLAPLCFLLLAQILIRARLFEVSLFIMLFVLLVLSQSRTSIFAIVLSLLVYALFAENIIIRYAKRFFILSIPIIAILIIFSGPISDILLDILTKGGGETSTFTESVERSRGALFFAQMQNIATHPFVGIGFKILSSGESNSFFEVASTDNSYEKGVFLLALIEEIGIIGALLFGAVLYSMLAHVFKRKVQSVVFFIPVCFLITTFGEATLLSIGGNGSLIWATIALSNYKYKVGER